MDYVWCLFHRGGSCRPRLPAITHQPKTCRGTWEYCISQILFLILVKHTSRLMRCKMLKLIEIVKQEDYKFCRAFVFLKSLESAQSFNSTFLALSTGWTHAGEEIHLARHAIAFFFAWRDCVVCLARRQQPVSLPVGSAMFERYPQLPVRFLLNSHFPLSIKLKLRETKYI